MHESVSDEYVTLDGLRFHYREWGNANAQPLVLLHGFGSQATSFDHFAAAMTDRCRVLALDQRGHGESDWAESYAAEAMVEDVGRFVAALGLKRLDLLGFSMGGRNALAFAAAHPETVERLVIVDMGPEIVMTGAARIRSMVSTRDVFDDPAEVFQVERAVSPYPTDELLWERIRNNLMQLPDGRWTWRYDKGLRDGTRPLLGFSAEQGWAMARAVRCPTLVLRGAESDILSREVAERMTREMADCRLVEIPHAAHNIPLHNPTAFLAAVRDFLV